MNTQSASQGKPDQNCGETEPGAKTGALPLVNPSRTRELFFHFEIGFKRTYWHPDRYTAPQKQQELSVNQPVLAFSAGAPRPPAPAGAINDVIDPGGNPGPPRTSAVYASAAVGTKTHP